MYDLIIIGSGPAGLTAAVYAARYALNTLVIGSSPGGQVAESGRVENYPGFKRIGGFELTQKMVEQVGGFGVEIVREEVSSIKYQVSSGKCDGGGFKISGSEGGYEARSVILAIGVEPRKLGIPGEEELLGKGVSYCALCDAPFYKDKVVAMVGGGDSAVDGALELAEHARKIYLINRSDKLRAKPDFVGKAKENSKIEFVLETNVTQINGESRVDSVTLDKSHSGQNQLLVEGIFIEIGNVPDRELPEGLGLDLDEYGYIKVFEDMSTNVAGVFAAGDITTGSNGMKQIVTACAEGAVAAQSAYRYLARGKSLPTYLPARQVPRSPKEKSPNSPESDSLRRKESDSFPLDSGKLTGASAGSKRKLAVDKDLCIGCGLCVTIAGNTFELGDDGKVQIKNPTADSEGKIQNAIDSCPVSAINWG